MTYHLDIKPENYELYSYFREIEKAYFSDHFFKMVFQRRFDKNKLFLEDFVRDDLVNILLRLFAENVLLS